MKTNARILMAAALIALAFSSAGTAEARYLERVGKAPAKAGAKKPVKKKASKKSSKKSSKKAAASQSRGSSLKTEFVFDGSPINGKYHSAGEAVAQVETEKQMIDLVGMRKDFKDRLAVERTRLKRAETVSAGQ